MGKRKLVTRAALNALLTERVQAIDDMQGTTISVSYLLTDPPEGSPNWADVVVQAGPSTTAEQAAAAAGRVVKDFQALYDVSD